MAAIEVETGYALERPFRERSASDIVGELYEQHQRMVRALCRLVLRNASDTDDAVQQTFLSAYKSLLSGTRPECPEAWLAVIARRECWARTSTRLRQTIELDDSVAGAEGTDALAIAIKNADFAAMWDAIRELPSQQRQVFLLREFSGLSYDEVSRVLGASESAVDALLVRARRQLRGRLEPLLKVAHAATVPFALSGKLRRVGGSCTRVGAGATKAASVSFAVKVGAVAATGIAAIAGSLAVAGRGPSVAAASGIPPVSLALQPLASNRTAASTPRGSGTAIDPAEFLSSLGDFASGAMPFASFTEEASAAADAPADTPADGAPPEPVDPGAGATETTPEPPAAHEPPAGGDPPAQPAGGGDPPAAPPDAGAHGTTPPANEPPTEPTPGDDPSASGAGADSPDASGSPTDPAPADPPPAAAA